jgi:hypothetical protein
MKTVQVNVPASILRGYLHDQMSEDMVEIDLPNGVCLWAGWYPENTPSGTYVIGAFQGEETIGRFEVKSIEDTARILELLCDIAYRVEKAK